MNCWKWVALVFLFTAAVTLGGCTTAPKPDTVKYVLEAEPATLDPAMSTALAESNVELQVFEGLTRIDKAGVPQPAMAERWSVSADGLVYTFYVRDQALWSDGTPVTAYDFEYAWKRVLNPETASPNAYMMYPLNNGEAYFKHQAKVDEVGVTALDDKTLQVRLKAPIAYFLGLTSFHSYYPVPRQAVEARPYTWAAEVSTLVSNGPFTLTTWNHANELVFTKNSKYWDRNTVQLRYMDWPISESQATRLTLVENDQANITVEPPPIDQTRLESTGLFKISPFLGSYYYVFNTEKVPFDDSRVRRAFSLVIDRAAIVKNIVRGGKQPAYAWVPPKLKDTATGNDFREEGGNYISANMAENVSKAKALLRDAGYSEQNPLPPVTILFNTNEMHKAIAESIQSMWKEQLGVEVLLLNQESKVYLAARNNGDFQVARASWIGDYADPMTFMDVFFDEDNDARYHNPLYNQYIADAQHTLSSAQRMSDMHKAEDILFDDAVIAPIYYTTQPYVARDYVKGYSWSLLGTIDFKEAYVSQ